MSMKLSAAAAGVILLAGAVGAIAEDVILVPEQETTIRQYVVKHPVEPLVLTPEVDMSVGSTLPDTVESLSVQDPSRGTVTLSKLPPLISSLQLNVVAAAGAAIVIAATRPMPRTIASLRILLPLPAFSAKSTRMLTPRTCRMGT